MGYYPDPMLQALTAYRQGRKPPTEHAPLAWLSGEAESVIRPDSLFSFYFKGAWTRARQFGYRLEEFLLGEEGMTSERMEKILLARGITGILIAPQPQSAPPGMIGMNWERFAAVTFGYTLFSPSLHRVTSHHGKAARLAVLKLMEAGYRRIGLYVGRTANTRVAGGWLGGFAGAVLENPTLAWIDPLLPDRLCLEEFLQWRQAKRIDAVITWGGFIDMVRQSGCLRIPEDLGMASLRVREENTDHSGVDQNDVEIGVTAVDTLLGMLRANERGEPTVRRSILIEGVWREGATTRRLEAPARPRRHR